MRKSVVAIDKREPRRAKVDKDFRAVCPWKPCKGKSELGLWTVAHLFTDAMTGKCAVCGKPILIDERENRDDD